MDRATEGPLRSGLLTAPSNGSTGVYAARQAECLFGPTPPCEYVFPGRCRWAGAGDISATLIGGAAGARQNGRYDDAETATDIGGYQADFIDSPADCKYFEDNNWLFRESTWMQPAASRRSFWHERVRGGPSPGRCWLI